MGKTADLQGRVDDFVAKGLEDAKSRNTRGKNTSPQNHLGITSESPNHLGITSESPNHLGITSESPPNHRITSESPPESPASHGTTACAQNLPLPPRLHGLSTWLVRLGARIAKYIQSQYSLAVFVNNPSIMAWSQLPISCTCVKAWRLGEVEWKVRSPAAGQCLTKAGELTSSPCLLTRKTSLHWSHVSVA